MFKNIRAAERRDLSRIAEIYVFNNRINYWPIFQDEQFSFGELQVKEIADSYFGKPEILKELFVYDDGVIKGLLQIRKTEICKLYVEPFFQNHKIGSHLIEYAVKEHGADRLWALEKNERAISFYQRHGFSLSGERKLEEGTEEFLVRLIRRPWD